MELPNITFDLRNIKKIKGTSEKEKGGFPNRAILTLSKKDIAQSKLFLKFAKTDIPPPEFYDLREVVPSLLTPPQNQGSCGSCFAFAISGAMNDTYALANNVFPNISPTSILRITLNNGTGEGCGGGYLGDSIDILTSVYVRANTCVDYSWCKSGTTCSTSNIPETFDSCFVAPQSRNRYIINSKKCFVSTTSSMTDLIATRNLAKDHIIKYGSLISGFLCWSNFQSGGTSNFSSTEGIYLECKDYNNNSWYTPFPNRMIEAEGGLPGHAICIIGWGISQNPITYKKLDTTIATDRIPYWICRNSWGQMWGEGGFFKIAMYPYNPFLVFDKACTIVDARYGTKSMGGGMYGISTIANPPDTITKVSTCGGKSCSMDETLPFYSKDRETPYLPEEVKNVDDTIIPTTGGTILEEKNMKMYLYIALGVIALFIIYLIFS